MSITIYLLRLNKFLGHINQPTTYTLHSIMKGCYSLLSKVLVVISLTLAALSLIVAFYALATPILANHGVLVHNCQVREVWVYCSFGYPWDPVTGIPYCPPGYPWPDTNQVKVEPGQIMRDGYDTIPFGPGVRMKIST